MFLSASDKDLFLKEILGIDSNAFEPLPYVRTLELCGAKILDYRTFRYDEKVIPLDETDDSISKGKGQWIICFLYNENKFYLKYSILKSSKIAYEDLLYRKDSGSAKEFREIIKQLGMSYIKEFSLSSEKMLSSLLSDYKDIYNKDCDYINLDENNRNPSSSFSFIENEIIWYKTTQDNSRLLVSKL